MIAANLFEQDLRTAQVAAALGVDDQTVRRWRRLYAAGGRESLKSSNKQPGRPPLPGDAERARLAELLLLQAPAECGFVGRYLWTQQLIADLIEREFRVTYHHDHVGVLLKRIGFTHQKPARRARERDEARIDGWRAEAWPALLKKVPTRAGWS